MTVKPQVFISWSGQESLSVGRRLHDFVQSVVQGARLFLSAEDLNAGDRWFGVISEALDSCELGIAVITPQNKLKPWIYFEAGAVAKRVGQARLIPLLCGVGVGELAETPLTQFQAKHLDEAGVFGIVKAIRDVGKLEITDERLRETFDVWWALKGAHLVDEQQFSGAAREQLPREITLRDLSVQIEQLRSVVVSDRYEMGIRDQLEHVLPRSELDRFSIGDWIYMADAQKNRSIVSSALHNKLRRAAELVAAADTAADAAATAAETIEAAASADAAAAETPPKPSE